VGKINHCIPDIMVEYYEDGDLVKLLIGEVKYTHNRQTFSQGLKELMEYPYVARLIEKYVLGGEFDLEDVLVVDKMDYLEGLDEFDGLEFELKVLDTEVLKGFKGF